MNKLKTPFLFLLAAIIISGCSSIPDRPWSDAIPEKAPFVIIPQEDATLNSVLQSTYAPFLDDITSSAVQLLSRVDSTATNPINLNAVMLYTGAENKLETVWIAKSNGALVKRMKQHFYKDFTQNQYYFNDVVINILHLGDRQMYVAQLHENLLLSESSLGIEDAIRAYTGELPKADLSHLSLQPGHIVMNTPSLDGWVQQLSQVTYRPAIQNILKGTKPTLLSVEQKGEQQNSQVQFSGTIPLNNETSSSNLVAAVSSSNAPITLDRYISSNASAFGLFRLPPRLAPPSALPDTSRLDSTLLRDQMQYSNIAKSLSQEFALVMYAQSGFLSTGEHLFLRKVSDISALRNELASLASKDYIERNDGTYFVRSSALARLIGSDLCGFRDFYLDITGEAVVISKRKGLVEIVSSDRSRRRTMFYEQQFRDIKKNLEDSISSLFVTNSEFYSFVEPFLTADSYLNAITSKYDILTASTALNEDNQSLSFSLNTYQTEDRTAPYQEKWIFPTGAELSGEPVLSNIGGSSRDEVIFATKSGDVYALAADGTVVMQANTGTDQPIGSPVVYDWYATNQNVILLAAGNKIYGWNDNGQALPKFPLELDEQITAPLLVNDIDRNGLPNALVATADRRLHALNGRGQNISGWPVTSNAEIRTKPAVDTFRGSKSVLAFSENAVHAWLANGDHVAGYPKFINSALNGSPLVYEGNILGNAADGYLYSVGPNKMFADSLNVFDGNSETSNTEAVYVSNSSLVGTPSVQQVTINSDEQVYNEPMILTMSSNGSVFLMNTSGQLRFTQNMGQPAASSFSPLITDIENDNRKDLMALANFGRLYVWEVSGGERLYTVPTAAMEYPIITDIDGDGYNELIAQTREGLRTWTIYGQPKESMTDNQ